MISRFTLLKDLSLRKILALALVVGLAVPVVISAWLHLTDRREALLERLAADHARIVEVLALGMQTPLWEIRPDAGKPLLEAVMLDQRITAITVSTPLMSRFLEMEAPQRRVGETVVRSRPVMRNSEEIGHIQVEMDIGLLESQLAGQWGQILLNGLVQCVTGIVIIFALLRFKVLMPLQRLVRQSEALAAGALGKPLEWRRQDELGVLGRSFEKMRQSLCDLFYDLEKRHRELKQRELELGNQASVLRAILDNMTDGVNLIDREQRLVAWNDRFVEIMELPPERVQESVDVKTLVKFSLDRDALDPLEHKAMLANILDHLHTDEPTMIRYTMANGKRIDIRRRRVPGGGFVSTFTDVTQEVETRRQVDETRHLLEAVMDAVPAMLHVKDRNLHYQMANRQFLTWWGLDWEAVIGKTNQAVFANIPGGVSEPIGRNIEAWGDWFEAQDQRVLETAKPQPLSEFFYDRGEAELSTFLVTRAPLLNSDGQVAHIVTVALDISQWKKAEQERQRWLRLLQDAIESIPNGFSVYDAAKKLVLCNSAFAALYSSDSHALAGCSAGELYQRVLPLIETVDGHSPEAVELAPHIADPTWTNGQSPAEVHFKDGRWLLISRHPTAEGGNVFIRTDITDLKRMEQALRDSELRFRSIAEAHPVPVVISALEEERLLYVSPGMANLFGATTAEILKRSPQDLFADTQDRFRVKTMLLYKGNLEAYECEMKKLDGRVFPAAITARRMHYLGVDAAVGGIIDMSEIRQAEQQIVHQREALYQSEKLNALGSLLAGVAHELNNPLSVVVGRSIMLEDTATDAKVREKVAKIRHAAERCARIVKTFLAIARQETPERSQVQINDIIQSAVELVGYSLRTADIDTQLDLDKNLPELAADADQLTQVFTNLIVNAEQALQGATSTRRLVIATRWEPDAEVVRITFTDNGPGVPEAIRARIFEPFYTSKPVGLGTGIGLSFSYGVVHAHGGKLSLENPAEGGACFIMTLPVADGASFVDVKAPNVVDVNKRYRILIVDDEPEIAEMLAEILRTEGHDIDIAESGNRALKRLLERDYDLILSDLKMPDLDGPGLYRQLQQSHPKMLDYIIFITGDTLGVGGSDFLAEAACPLIEKPFIPDEVIQVVRQALGRVH